MLQAGRYAEVESRVRELLEQHPDSGAMWQMLGVVLARQGRDAVHASEMATKLLPGDAGAHNNLGNALARQGRLDQAVASYRQALKLNPGIADAHHNLANALSDLGQFEQAAASYRRALELNPQLEEAHNHLGNVLFELGQLDDAFSHYRRALLLKPDFAEAHNNVGGILRGFGQLEEAIASYRQAMALQPHFAEAHSNLGSALRLLGRTAEAQASCLRALAINPNLTAAVATLAEIHADAGEFAEAEQLFKRAISIDPESAEGWSGISRLRKMSRGDKDWLSAAQTIAARHLPPRKEVQLRYAIGKYFDDVQDFDQAFSNFRRANELAKQYGAKHERRDVEQAVDQITRTYDRIWMSQARELSSPSERPAFIIGMLRSGTTLAEQILASHPAVHGAGELPFWTNAFASFKSSAAGTETSAALARTLAGEYLRLLQELSADALRVIDKMPANVWVLGLIHAALPNARIIHMRRNPIDTCLSIYFQRFETGVSYANDLEDLAHYYTQYLRVVMLWRSILPPDSILEVPYEGLVANPDAWTRKMLAFIGLPWDPRCVDFHLTQRTVITASKWQVRQKISAASVDRWRHYEKFISPLLKLKELDPGG